MRITKEMLSPSREDAVRLNRSEKMGMILFAHVATVLEDLQTEMADRFAMVKDGAERLKHVSEETDKLLDELRVTIPVNQRLNLQNTAQEYEVRLTPKATPTTTNVVMTKDEFREMVDYARSMCMDCMLNEKECQKCNLYQMLTVLLPLDDYNNGMLCPYNMGEWAN